MSFLPSPSKSCIVARTGSVAVATVTPFSKFTMPATKLLLSNLGRNALGDAAVKLDPVLFTVIGAYVAPIGTVTFSMVADAAFTVARVAPK